MLRYGTGLLRRSWKGKGPFCDGGVISLRGQVRQQALVESGDADHCSVPMVELSARLSFTKSFTKKPVLRSESGFATKEAIHDDDAYQRLCKCPANARIIKICKTIIDATQKQWNEKSDA